MQKDWVQSGAVTQHKKHKMAEQSNENNDVDVLFMLDSQNIAAKLKKGSTKSELLEQCSALFGIDCQGLQLYDQEWEEWVNLNPEFTLSHRVKLKVLGKPMNEQFLVSSSSWKHRQTELVSIDGSLRLESKAKMEKHMKPPYS